MNKLSNTIIIAILMVPVLAIAQEGPQHDTQSAEPVHEITGSSDMLRIEARVIFEPVPFWAMNNRI